MQLVGDSTAPAPQQRAWPECTHVNSPNAPATAMQRLSLPSTVATPLFVLFVLFRPPFSTPPLPPPPPPHTSEAHC